MRHSPPPDARTSVILVALGLVFGSAFLCVKVLVDDLTPMQVAASRLALAAGAVLVVLAVGRKLRRPSAALLVGGSVLGLLDAAIPYTLIAWGQQGIDSGVASVLMSTLPLFTVLFAVPTLPDERLSAGKLAGLVLGFAGVAVIAGRGALDFTDGLSSSHLAVMAGAMCYGAAGVYGRVLARRHTVIDLTAVKFTTGAAVAGALSLMIDGVPSGGGLSAGGIAALLVLGVVSTGLGRLVYLWTIVSAGSVRASLVTYIIPVSGLLLGWAVLGEQIAPSTVGGMALIVAGVAGALYTPPLSLATLPRRWAFRAAATRPSRA